MSGKQDSGSKVVPGSREFWRAVSRIQYQRLQKTEIEIVRCRRELDRLEERARRILDVLGKIDRGSKTP